MKKKVTVELIVDENVELGQISGIIEVGCREFALSRYETPMSVVHVKLKPELVVCTPFNKDHLCMVLNETEEHS